MIRFLLLAKFQKLTVILSPWGEDKGEGYPGQATLTPTLSRWRERGIIGFTL
jgi:hypothetical protein